MVLSFLILSNGQEKLKVVEIIESVKLRGKGEVPFGL